MDKDKIIILLIFDIRKEKHVGTRECGCLEFESLLNASVFDAVTTTKAVVVRGLSLKAF